MKFAKYWQQILVPVNQSLFGRNEVSVWGASNDSDEAALYEAQQRAKRFQNFFSRGFDHSKDYEYSTGFIREEIVDEIKDYHGNPLAILTRNSYGATVLNTEQVLIGDIDYPSPGLLDKLFFMFGKKPKDKNYFLNRLKQYQKEHTTLKIEIYETFGGLRFIFCDKLYSANSEQVTKIFEELEVDPLYALLCKRQACFRARLTPKPWRIGLNRPGSRFPRHVDSEIQQFQTWLENYQRASKNNRSARKVASFGTASTHPDVQPVIDIHDTYACRKDKDLA